MCQAPLLLLSASSYLQIALNAAGAFTMATLTCTGLATLGSLTCSGRSTLGTLTCNGAVILNAGLSEGDAILSGNVTINGFVDAPGTCWVSGKVSSSGNILGHGGANTFTVSRPTGQAAGAFRITFSAAHWIGANYTVLLTGVGVVPVVRTTNMTSTYFELLLYNSSWTQTDGYFHFMVMNC